MIYIIFIIIIMCFSISAYIRSKVESYYFYPVIGENENNALESVIDNHRAILYTKNIIIENNNELENNDNVVRNVLLVAHGNGGNVYNRKELIDYISKMYDGDIYCFEYPGYGACEGKASVKSCIAECLWWIRYLSTRYKHIDLYGESIGGGIIMQSYKNLNDSLQNIIGTIYLQSTFCSIYYTIKDMNHCIAAFYRLLWKDDLNTLNILRDPICRNKRIVFIHSPDDEVISYDQACENYQECCSIKKLFFETMGSHNYTELSSDMFKK
jgi:hypothetical protein